MAAENPFSNRYREYRETRVAKNPFSDRCREYKETRVAKNFLPLIEKGATWEGIHWPSATEAD